MQITENKDPMEDYRLFSNLSEDEWIDILSDDGTSATCNSDNTDCLSVLDRVCTSRLHLVMIFVL